ncbi:unnamed protein product [Lampetra planeri]
MLAEVRVARERERGVRRRHAEPRAEFRALRRLPTPAPVSRRTTARERREIKRRARSDTSLGLCSPLSGVASHRFGRKCVHGGLTEDPGRIDNLKAFTGCSGVVVEAARCVWRAVQWTRPVEVPLSLWCITNGALRVLTPVYRLV